MKRSRKSTCNTPVQKTTLLNFFSPTPSTTPSTPKSHLTQLIPSVPVTPGKSSKVEIDLNETQCPACQLSMPSYKLNDHLDIECTTSLQKVRATSARKKEIETIDITVESSSSMSTSNKHPSFKKNSATLNFLAELSRKTEATTDLSCAISTDNVCTPPKRTLLRGSFLDSSPINDRKALLEPVRAYSSSKIYDQKRDEFTGEYSDQRLVETDVKKYKQKLKKHVAIKRKLFADDTKPQYHIPYYLENFQFSLKSSFNEPLYQHLYTDEDSKYYNSFQLLSLNAQKLYVRLFTRKYQWKRQEKIKYDDIAADLNPVLEELCASSLLAGINELEDLIIMIELLFQPELKQIFKELKVAYNSKGNAVQDLIKHCRNQPCLKGINSKSMSSVIMAKAKRYLTKCYKLKEEPRRVFLRLCMLSSLHQRQEEEEEKGQQHQMFTMLQVTTGRRVFPSYQIRRQRTIFQMRDHLIRYEGAVLLETQVREALEKQEWQTVLEQTDPIVSSLPQEFENNAHDLQLPHFLRRFTAAAVHIYILNKRIEALQRLKQYQSAVDVLSMLIDQECYLLTHRGHWYERIVLNTEQHLKNPLKALELIRSGLNDSWVSPSHKLALSQRATRICQSAKLKDKFESFLVDLPLLNPAEPRNNTIVGRSLPSESSGQKSVFIRGDSGVTPSVGDITLCSVEELVLQHYLENGYSHGLHAEGSTVWSIIGLLFWDIIYQSDVADVFLSPFQTYPLDFDSLDFFPSRQQSIDKRLDCLKSWSTDEITDHITSVWNANHGTTSLVSWDRFQNLDHVNGLVQCIPAQVLTAISQRILSNYRHYRSGFPDLTLWNPETKKLIIVEVKGPNDRLSTKQILWLDFLTSIGVQAEVCYVQAVGAKRMGATVQATRQKTPRTAGKEQVHSSGRQPRSKRVKLDSSVDD